MTNKSDPKVLAWAETVRAEIDREAKTKQSAIEAIFGGESTATGSSRGKAKSSSDA